jgi:hypothetical protein
MELAAVSDNVYEDLCQAQVNSYPLLGGLRNHKPPKLPLAELVRFILL